MQGALAPKLRDVSTPFVGRPCDCHDRRRDGVTDLLLRFPMQALVEQLQLDMSPAGVPVPLALGGVISNRTTFRAVDCVLSRHDKRPRP